MSKALSLFQITLCTFCYLYATSNTTLAQVTSDGTVNTQVNQNGNVAEITEGETRGGNLFHSFQDFSVPTGNEAFFDNANNISNIFSRVSGGNVSNIDGAIRANGSASLFLINPAGIIFGNNARLDIGGSFLASTASSILFENGEFSAADLTNPPILTVNAPVGLDFRDNSGDIVNRSDFTSTEIVNEGTEFELTITNRTGLAVRENRNISLIGGSVEIINSGLTAPGGKITIGGLSQAGTINFDNDNGSFVFSEEIGKANVSLVADTDSFGESVNFPPTKINVVSNGGGSIDINANEIFLENANLELGINNGLSSAVAEDINIVGNSVNFNKSSILFTVENGVGTIGDINIAAANNVSFQNSDIRTEIINSEGTIGNINIAANSIDFESSSILSSSFVLPGTIPAVDNANVSVGNINLNANSAIFLDRSEISYVMATGGDVNIGDININAESIALGGNTLILSRIVGFSSSEIETEQIQGDINLTAEEFINLDTTSQISSSSENVFGVVGDINLTAQQINLNNISSISSGTLSGNSNEQSVEAQNTSNINLIAQDSISLNNNSSISSESRTGGRTGDINLETDNLSIFNGSDIAAQTFRTQNDASNINIEAKESIDISDINSGIFSRTAGTGDAGNIAINTSELKISNSGQISADNFILERSPEGVVLRRLESFGNAGIIDINATNIILEDRGSLTAISSAGEGGNIDLQVDNVLSLRNNSEISAAAGELDTFGNGGNINIDSQFIVAFPQGNNDITANAFDGAGGNIIIATEGIFGIEERIQSPFTNDIAASSEAGIFGSITITTPDINTVQGATELSTDIIVPEETSQQACEANRELAAKNGLNITGKGGILPSPDLPLNSVNVFVDGETEPTSVIPQPIETSRGKIQPARGIKVAESGEIILTAYRTNNAGDRIPGKRNCS